MNAIDKEQQVITLKTFHFSAHFHCQHNTHIGSIKPNRIIKAAQARNTTSILFINGIDAVVYFNKADKGILIRVTANASFELDRFQKKPMRNMAKIPGEINPVNLPTPEPICLNY